MRKPIFCIFENKDADQLRGNREADQRHCFRYTVSTIPVLSKSEISSPVCVGSGRKPRRLVFSQRGLFYIFIISAQYMHIYCWHSLKFHYFDKFIRIFHSKFVNFTAYESQYTVYILDKTPNRPHMILMQDK